MVTRATLVLVFLFVPLSCAFGQAPFTAEFAFRTLYGNYDAKTKTATWKDFTFPTTGKEWDRNKFVCDTESEPLRVRQLLDKATVEDGVPKHYFITWASPASWGDFHGRICTAAIGATIFAQRNGKWEIEISDRYASSAGSYGNAPSKVRFVELGQHRHGIIMETYDMTQGYHGAGSKLLAQVGSEFKELFFENIYSDNSGRCGPEIATTKEEEEPCFKSVKEISFAQTTEGDYPDIRLVSHGTSLNSEHKLVPENWIKVLRFQNGEYVLLKKTNIAARQHALKNQRPQ